MMTIVRQFDSRQIYRIGGLCAIIFFTYEVFYQLSLKDRWHSSGLKLSSDGSPLVKLQQGSYIGEKVQFGALREPVEQFVGIPYALPPTGMRRYRPAEKLPVSGATFEATKFGLRCPTWSGRGTGEDCLVADIVRPATMKGKSLLPVLIYVHGGSFYGGNSRDRQLANMMSWSEKPFIAISFNYRLGALGFLPSPSLHEASNLNLGLKDQALFFEWVQDNVAQFNGDPNDVTLMGLSAGAHSIGHHLMSSNGRKALFHKVIIESGASTARACFAHDSELTKTQYEEFLKEVGLKGVPESGVIERLRSLPVATINEAANKIWDRYAASVRWPFQPVIDGPNGFIPKAPIEAWQAGQWHKMPILTGFNTHEGSQFVSHQMKTSREFDEFFATLLPNFHNADLETLKTVYPDPSQPGLPKYTETRPGLGAQTRRLIAAYGQWAYIAPVRYTAHQASMSPSKNTPASEKLRPPVYLFHFAVNMSVSGGANHGAHSPFVTYSRDITKKSIAAEAIAGTIHAYFTSFITNGDPNAVKGRFPDRPEWVPYKATNGKKMLFGEGSDEFAGGQNPGTLAQLVDDEWAKVESDFWWSRAGLSEM